MIKCKLKLCEQTKWNTAGKEDPITNLASIQLTDTEKAALSLGLKSDTGVDTKSYIEHVSGNYRWKDSDADKGFKQGVLACCKALSTTGKRNSYKIPNGFERTYEQ